MVFVAADINGRHTIVPPIYSVRVSVFALTHLVPVPPIYSARLVILALTQSREKSDLESGAPRLPPPHPASYKPDGTYRWNLDPPQNG